MLHSAGSIALISAASSQENSSARGGLLSLTLSDSRCELWMMFPHPLFIWNPD